MELAGHSISHEAIYQYVYARAKWLVPYLARRHSQRQVQFGRKRRKRGAPIPARTAITERPAAANERREVGHWEVDTAHSRLNGAVLLVVTDRKSRLTRIARLERATSHNVEQGVVRLLQRYPERDRKSLTYDNGAENSRHLLINQALGTSSYFCAPYHSWEKGTVENTIGFIRRLIKRDAIQTLSGKEIRSLENKINSRPKKCLNFHTPREIFTQRRVALGP